MKMTGILLVFSLVFVCLISFTSISYAAATSRDADAVFTDVILNVGADETERNLTWYSNSNTTGEVQYADATSMVGESFPAVYSTARARVSAAGENGSYVYKATMQNLEANTRYAYRMVTGDSVSSVRYFEVRDFDDSFSFIYLSDPQVGSTAYKNAWIDTLEKIDTSFSDASFIVSGGDQVATSTSEVDYDNFIVDGVSKIAIAPTNGPGHDNSALYMDHFNLPNLSTSYGLSAATSNYYYTYNSALFVHINIDNRSASEHIAFIKNAIKNNPDAIWQFVVIHWSFYSGSSESQHSTVTGVAQDMIGEMNDLGIDIVFSGHDHFYARSNLITDFNTVSDDVVTDNTVTDPEGTLYVCASSATANGITQPVSTDYVAYHNADNRKSVLNITLSEDSLKLDAYFLDNDTPELLDSFTINRTLPKVRVNSHTDMLELNVNGERKSLVNAYAYTRAAVKVIDGYWSVSTDGGTSFASLGIAATSSYENSVSFRIDESTGYWQFSENGGSSYEDLPVNVKRYSITYVTDADTSSGVNLSDYKTVTCVEGINPDPPSLVLPAGSFDEGIFYEWSWEYKNKDGSEATAFTAGNEYVAYITADITKISNDLYIASATDKTEGVYTWRDAWDIAIKFPDEAFTFTLIENVTATSTVTLISKTDVTVDLAGYTLKTSGTSYAINYNTGSTGSSFALVSSKMGGTVNSKSFVCLTTSQVSSVNVSYGSDDGYPVTLNANDSTYGYLLFAGGNFKRGSTVNFSITNGTYTATNGILYVDNAADDLSAANHYKVNISDANITVGQSPVCFKGARKASASSYLSAVDSSITVSSGSASVVSANQWYGSFSFDNCELNGVTFADSAITNISGATFGDGTTFTNSDDTFNSDKTAFASSKLSMAEGCSLSYNGDVVAVSSAEPLPDNVLLIAKTANHTAKIYTWREAWDIAMANPDTAYIFMLTENSNMGGSELLQITAKCNVTLDLAGFAMKVSANSNYLITYGNSSSGSTFSVISSKEGGSYYGPTLVFASSSGASNLTFNIGSQDSYPITVTTFKTVSPYSSKGSLIGVNGNFKNGSTLNAYITNGTYILEGEVLSTNNYSGNLNTFKVTISDADITVGTAVISFASTHNTHAASFFKVYNSTISSSADTKSFTAANQWYGSLEFENCSFNGIVFDASNLTNISSGIFKRGCSFTNYGATFNSDTSAFASNKLTAEDGYAPFLHSNGTVSISILSGITGISVTLAEDISINFFAILNDAHQGAVMKFTVNGTVVLVNGVATEDGKWKYVFSGIGPQSMTVPVHAELMLGEDVIGTLSNVSVKSYCDMLLDMSHEELEITEEKFNELKVLVANLLKYGACAQIYKGYNLENLADADVDESLLIEFVNPNAVQTVGESSTPGMSFTGATVWFDNVNSICIRFTVTDLAATTVKINGVEYDSSHFNKVGENTYTIFTDAIPPLQYNSSFVFELCLNGEAQQEAVYSIACYVTAIQNSSNEDMKNLAQAMYNYSIAAADYNS